MGENLETQAVSEENEAKDTEDKADTNKSTNEKGNDTNTTDTEEIPNTNDTEKISDTNTNAAEKNDTNKVTETIKSKRSFIIDNLKNSNDGLTLGSKKSFKEENLLADSKTVVRFSPLYKQLTAASAPILLTLISGLTSGYSAVLLPQLQEEHGPIPGDEDTGSWIAAMAALPMAPGCLLSGLMMEKFGRRTSHYIICAPLLLGWILIASANNLTVMLVGRFLTGFCVGLCGPLCPVYIGETTEPKYRGFFLAAVSLAIAMGLFVAHLIGTFMTWQWTATIFCLFPIIGVLLLTFVPESPTWLISKGRVDEGIKSFGWLRGYSDEANAELKGILEKQKAADSEPVMNWKEKVLALKSPALLKPLFIMIFFFVICQFSGVNAIAFYSVTIVERSVGNGIDRHLAMLIIDAVRVVMSVIACVACRRYGRRPLCFISGVFTALSMIGLSMFKYWSDGSPGMSWLPLTCLIMYICAVSMGLVPLPWIMCGEVFPTRVRGLGSGISSATTFTAFFVVVKTAPGMMVNFGEVFTFLVYGVVALLGTGVLYFILPETKGKSLQEIEEEFKNGRKSDPKV